MRSRLPSGQGLAWYLDLSQRPLQILIFLLPLVILYELGTWRYAGDGETLVISAQKMLSDFFELFSVTGLYLPGFALVAVLLAWHAVSRDKWEVHLGVPAVMFVESVVLAMPLLVMDGLIHRLFPDLGISTGAFQLGSLLPALAGGPPGAGAGSAVSIWADLPWQTRLVLSLGAGLYEELVFRMILIALAHFVLVDALGVKHGPGAALSLLISAAAFTLYHDLAPQGRGVEAHAVLFYFTAGLYFASLYVVRGFGIAVGAHAVYDALVIVILPALSGGLDASG